MSVENGASEFSVALPSPEVRQKAHRYMLDRGFGIEANLTGDVVEYTALRPRRFLLRLVGTSPDFYRVSLSIRRQAKGRTHLIVKASKRGRWPEIRSEMERWIVEELGGEPLH